MTGKPDLAGLTAMSSLGRTSAQMLIEAGVSSPTQLRQLGAEAAYRALRFTHGARAKATYLYALDIAIRGIHWSDLTAARMAQLRAAARRIQDELRSG